MELNTLQALYVERLRDLYSAEQQIVKALPKMMQVSTNEDLRSAFEAHLEETKEQITRLEEICDDLGVSPKGKKCKGMEGLLAEGTELIEEDPEEEILDAGLIASAQAVEHYEMAGYGTARAYAELLGFENHVELLQATLDEEAAADEKLNDLALSTVNLDALMLDQEVDLEDGDETAPPPRNVGGSRKRSNTERDAEA